MPDEVGWFALVSPHVCLDRYTYDEDHSQFDHMGVYRARKAD